MSATSTSSGITVQWEMVPCIHRNGVITSYSVQYEVVGSGSPQTVPVSGGDTVMTVIHDIESSTTYSIQVAAVNGELIGPYSNVPVIVETPQSKYTLQCRVSLAMFCSHVMGAIIMLQTFCSSAVDNLMSQHTACCNILTTCTVQVNVIG